VKAGLIDRVEDGFGLGVVGVVSPVSIAEGEGLVAAVLVQDRVPEGVKVADTADAGVNPFGVATPVALGVLCVDLSDSVEGLMEVTYEVDDKTEGERLLVGHFGEIGGDLGNVGAGGHIFTLEESGEVSQSVQNVSRGLHKEGVILNGATVRQVGLVDEMPAALEGVALALDVVGEGSALSEGVVQLVLGQFGVRLSQRGENGQGGVESGGGVDLEEGLSMSGDCSQVEWLVFRVLNRQRGGEITYREDVPGPRRRLC